MMLMQNITFCSIFQIVIMLPAQWNRAHIFQGNHVIWVPCSRNSHRYPADLGKEFRRQFLNVDCKMVNIVRLLTERFTQFCLCNTWTLKQTYVFAMAYISSAGECYVSFSGKLNNLRSTVMRNCGYSEIQLKARIYHSTVNHSDGKIKLKQKWLNLIVKDMQLK